MEGDKTKEESEAIGDQGRATTAVRSRGLTVAEQERVKGMQRLAQAPDCRTYVALVREIAEQLKMTERNVRYLIRAWQG